MAETLTLTLKFSGFHRRRSHCTRAKFAEIASDGSANGNEHHLGLPAFEQLNLGSGINVNREFTADVKIEETSNGAAGGTYSKIIKLGEVKQEVRTNPCTNDLIAAGA